MLTFIFKNKFIQWLRRNGYSKAQAIRIYQRFIKNQAKDDTLQNLISYVITVGMVDPFNYHLISAAFCWSDSPQGHNYWAEIKLKVEGVEECHM